MKFIKVIRKQGKQILVLPEEFKIKGEKLVIKKQGDHLLLFELDNPWKKQIESLRDFSSGFEASRMQGKFPTRELLFK